MRDRARAHKDAWLTLLGIGAATAAAHIGNNFTTYLIGGLIDRFSFTPGAMGVWSMTESLSYAAAMFLIAPRAGRLRPRTLALLAGLLVIGSQATGALTSAFPLLLVTRIGTGVGFGLANTALNIAAGATRHPARAISIGISCQTLLYAGVNIGLPLVGRELGVAGMFLALSALSALLMFGSYWLPNNATGASGPGMPGLKLGADEARILLSMALFTFGSLAIWPFMERAAHAIDITAVEFGRIQSIATLASALGNVILAATVGRIRYEIALGTSLLVCGTACAVLTTASSPMLFAAALIAYNVAWFVSYPLLLGIAYRVDRQGSLSVLCSAAWLLMTSLGSLTTGLIAQGMGGYGPVGPLGLLFCLFAIACAVPLAYRVTRRSSGSISGVPSKTG